jgi:Zn finger protein HypA/HybF involved in hydrogenase expression
VTLEVGARAGVLADAIAFCFPIVADGTVCAGARLEIRATGGGELNVKEMEVEAA